MSAPIVVVLPTVVPTPLLIRMPTLVRIPALTCMPTLVRMPTLILNGGRVTRLPRRRLDDLKQRGHSTTFAGPLHLKLLRPLLQHLQQASQSSPPHQQARLQHRARHVLFAGDQSKRRRPLGPAQQRGLDGPEQRIEAVLREEAASSVGDRRQGNLGALREATHVHQAVGDAFHIPCLGRRGHHHLCPRVALDLDNGMSSFAQDMASLVRGNQPHDLALTVLERW
mmetsp:Transcript_169873/g.545150  ORF Transcript_169873/g.545150 Transcript_169873/m.545150 type:complete len:225 (-) Transcript_169873:855-1529(-)